MHAMPATRVTIPMVVAASTVLMLVLPAIVPGCGPGSLDVDKAALYTPESLASELAFRFRSLNADAKTSTRKATDPTKPRRAAGTRADEAREKRREC